MLRSPMGVTRRIILTPTRPDYPAQQATLTRTLTGLTRTRPAWSGLYVWATPTASSIVTTRIWPGRAIHQPTTPTPPTPDMHLVGAIIGPPGTLPGTVHHHLTAWRTPQ